MNTSLGIAVTGGMIILAYYSSRSASGMLLCVAVYGIAVCEIRAPDLSADL